MTVPFGWPPGSLAPGFSRAQSHGPHYQQPVWRHDPELYGFYACLGPPPGILVFLENPSVIFRASLAPKATSFSSEAPSGAPSLSEAPSGAPSLSAALAAAKESTAFEPPPPPPLMARGRPNTLLGPREE